MCNFYVKLFVVVLLIFIVLHFVKKSTASGTYRSDYDFYKIFHEGNPLPRVSSSRVCLKKNETRCREILENIFKPHLFPSVRPSFLKNPKTGRNLEIDCYNSNLRIGLEYQGIQHRKYTKWYHRSVNDFRNQVDRDNYKKKKLNDENIFMIYVPDTIKFYNLEKYIREKLKEL